MIEASPGSILYQYCLDQSLFTDPLDETSWPLYCEHLPDEIGDMGVIIGTAGTLDGRIMVGGEVIQHYGINIQLRCTIHSDGWAKAKNIIDSFSSVHNNPVTVGSDAYVINNITTTTPVTPLGLEKGTKRRFLFSLNFIATISTG